MLLSLLWFRWAGCEKEDRSPHGRDGHAPLFRCKVQFQKDWYYTKSCLLLHLSRGAQRVSPVCCGMLLWFRSAGARKMTSLHTAETAMRPFSAAKSNFKGTMVLLRGHGSDLGHIGLKIHYARNAVNESKLRERFDYIVTDSHSRDFEDIFLPGFCGQHNHWHSA